MSKAHLLVPIDCVIRSVSPYVIDVESLDTFPPERLFRTRWNRDHLVRTIEWSIDTVQWSEQIVQSLVHQYGLEQVVRISELQISEPETNVA